MGGSTEPGGEGGSAPLRPLWPARLHALLRPLAAGEALSEGARGELWLLLNSALLRYLESHGRRVGPVAREDREDIASEKALDLLQRAESGMWDIGERSPGEVAAYLSRVARNGLVDHLRRAGREVDRDDDAPDPQPADPTPDDPGNAVLRKEFARALRACVETLQPRSRRIWFFRVFYDLTSKEIARHPEVQLRASHVDVLLQRCRRAVRACMENRGLRAEDMPPGTFVELWRVFGRPTGLGEDA